MPYAPRQSSTREQGVLLLGIVSAVVLVVAAFLPANDPETVARTALAQLAARTERAVVDEWTRSLLDPAPLAPASSDPFVHAGRADLLEALPPRTPADPAPDDPAAGALIAEAERLEWTGGARAEVEALAAEALARPCSLAQRLRAGAALLRAALGGGDTRAAAAAYRALLPDLERTDARTAVLGAQCILAAAPLAGAHDGLQVDELVRALDLRGLIEACPVAIERLDGPRVWYRLRGMEPLAAIVERCARLPFPPGAQALLRAALARAGVAALEERLGGLPGAAGSAAWTLLPDGEDWFALASAADGSWTGAFVTRDDLGAALVERLRAAELLPEGLELDFAGDRAALGVALRPRVELSGPGLAFTLRHEDPEALVRAQSRRQSWLRAALFVMAAFAAGAGFAMARALRRERKLAEAKATFIANVSHELRTPLASILLMAENLEAGRTHAPEAALRYHGLIRREALRLARLVDDVLDFSRLERGKRLDVRREDVDVPMVVAEWAAEFRAWAAEHALELAVDVRDLPAGASIDREALRRALSNLLDNARKHSGSKRARFEARGEGTELVLRVADEGVGIPRGERASVFVPFERLREGQDAAPGTGLGLAIVKEIALAHGGTIAVRDAERGSGAVFELRLPCHREGEEDG